MLKPFDKAEITFHLKNEIGQEGKNSSVFLAHDPQLDAEIAVKRVLKSSFQNPAEFFEESKALYLSAHPNVVQIRYACQDAASIYLVLPFYKRGSVNKALSSRALTVREIITVSCQSLAGLHNIHSKKLIHFDVKPDNILFDDQGEAVISDFGLAKQMNFYGSAQQDRNYLKMTPPEVWSTANFNLRFDIYQFGLTLYRMCCGNESFYRQFAVYGDSGAFDRTRLIFDVRNGRFPDRKLFEAHIPEALRKVVRRCLEPDPNARFASALEVANALAVIEGNEMDWRITRSPDKAVWTRDKEGTKYVFSWGSDKVAACTKDVGKGPKNQSAACGQMTEREVRNFLKTH